MSKILRQDLVKYRILFPHVSAALQLIEAGKPIVCGDSIQYIYPDATHTNPLHRVMPVDLISEGQVYDRDKYRDMLLEAAETVLGYFGWGATGRFTEMLGVTKTESGGIQLGIPIPVDILSRCLKVLILRRIVE